MTTEKDKLTRRKETGKRIRQEREKPRMTREELADRADITPRFLADIESGIKGMSVDTLCSLCSELDVSLDHIVKGPEGDTLRQNSRIRDMQEMMELLFRGLDERGFRFLEDVYTYSAEERNDEGGPDGPDGKEGKK